MIRRLPAFLSVVFLCFVALFVVGDSARAQAPGINPVPPSALTGGAVPGRSSGTTNDSEFWRQIRKGTPGRVSIPDPHAAIMVRESGEQWRVIRSQWLPYYGAIPIVGMTLLILLFYVIRGRIRIEGGRSGRTVPRFQLWHRTMHWFVACLFILLGLSGLILLFGRVGLIPLIGKEAFAVFASASLQGHNLFGPIFVVVFFPMVLMFLKGNGFNLVDLKWILKGGGLFGGHASSEKNNFGEKGWYWLLTLGGTVLCLSGLLLDFPWLAEKTGYLNIAHVAHAVAAIAVITVAIGHIYIGSLGMEGALEGMTKGEVDENWAIQHHDLWAQKVMGEQAAKKRARDEDADGVPVPAE
ncbi:MAG: formate dehydrogenase subunit gamma [Hyphomicrobiales bacterium]|nr:MAG: formate dehydrogenase subunit gamma [Hyphomicrobiales bacterium]